MAIIRKLTLSFRGLALGILLLAFFFQSLSAKQAADSFFSGAHSLVIAAFRTTWVVRGNTAGGGDGVRAKLADCVRGFFLCCCLVFGSITFYLLRVLD